MLKTLRTIAGAAAVLAATLAVSAPSQAEELKMGLITPPGHVWTKAAVKFGETLKEKSSGRYSVVVFPGGQLGNEPEMFQQIQGGLLDMGLMTGALTSLRSPAMVAWFTPFLFDSVEEAAAAARTPAARQMLDDLEGVGMKGLGYSFAGMRHILLTKDAATSLSDVQGKKIRIVPFPAMKEWWEATGAVPTPVQLPDVYQALQNGLLDGVDIDLDALVGSKFHEVAKGLTMTGHMAFPAVAVMGTGRWNALSAADQALIQEAMDDTLAWATTEQTEAERRNLATLEAAISVHKLANAEAVFADANAAFADAFGSQELIRAFQEQVKAQQ